MLSKPVKGKSLGEVKTCCHALRKKAVNAIDDVVITFYDEDDILTNTKTGVVTKDTYKVTHTWKKFGNTCLIIGGMAGYKQ